MHIYIYITLVFSEGPTVPQSWPGLLAQLTGPLPWSKATIVVSTSTKAKSHMGLKGSHVATPRAHWVRRPSWRGRGKSKEPVASGLSAMIITDTQNLLRPWQLLKNPAPLYTNFLAAKRERPAIRGLHSST